MSSERAQDGHQPDSKQTPKSERLLRADAKESNELPRVTRASVLVIESDPLMLAAMSSVLDMRGHRAVMARSKQIAMDSIAAGEFDVIVLSIENLQEGCSFAQDLRESETTKDVPIIYLVPEMSPDWAQPLSEQGGVYSMLQPIDPTDLIELVEKSLWLPHLARGKHATETRGHQRGANADNSLAKQGDWIRLSR